jgi:nucleotide-binding universal stress UspA family protein
MAKRIVVPLDLTIETEAVLPLVADVARGAGSTVRLLHVAPWPGTLGDDERRIAAYADRERERLEAEALDYLNTVELQFDGIPVESTVRFGDPVDEILREAETFGADLIALTARDAHPFSGLVLAGTTEQVCRRAEAPVMVFRPGAAGVVS